MVADLIRSYGQRRVILPRSRHLPFASTEGSSTRNFNKTGVRLWSACSGSSSPCNGITICIGTEPEFVA